MKRVAIFRNALLPSSETFIKEQALALTEWSPILVGYRLVESGLNLGALPVQLLPGMTGSRLKQWHTKALQWLGKPHKPTVRALRDLNVNLVHAHFGTDATDIWPSVKAARLPMLVTLHGYDINTYREWWQAGHGGPRRRMYPKNLLEMASDPSVRFIAVSKAIKARAVEYGIHDDKISVTYIGVDTERFIPGSTPIEQRAKRVLFVGRMVEKKAPLLLIRAWQSVLKEVPDAELIMIGVGPLLRDAVRLAEQLHLPVKFLGVCNTEVVLAQMQHARVFCLPSVVTPSGDAEGLPIVILEALACGLPVVTSANGAVGEVVTNMENGFTFRPHDVISMTTSLVRLLSDDALWRVQSQHASCMSNEIFPMHRTSGLLSRAYDAAIL